MWKVGNAPTSWGIEEPAGPAYPHWSVVLDEIAKAGYAGLELGPLGFFPTEPIVLAAELSARGLELSGGTVMEPLDDATSTAGLLERAATTCELARSLGGSHLVLIDGLGDERSATAGRSAAARRLDPERWRVLVDSVVAVSAMAIDGGVSVAFHPHAGTHVEFADEVERIAAETDPALVKLCVDTGHSVYAGIDPAELIVRHGERVGCVHLKDVDPSVLAGARDGAAYDEAYARGVFCVLGTGCVDFEAVRDALAGVGYRGWLIVEQDALPGSGSVPYDDAVQSLAFLRKVGLAG